MFCDKRILQAQIYFLYFLDLTIIRLFDGLFPWSKTNLITFSAGKSIEKRLV